jgi:hypothetical protein
MLEMVGMLLMIALISGALVGSGIVLGLREDRDRELGVARKVKEHLLPGHLDPNAHLGRTGTE